MFDAARSVAKGEQVVNWAASPDQVAHRAVEEVQAAIREFKAAQVPARPASHLASAASDSAILLAQLTIGVS